MELIKKIGIKKYYSKTANFGLFKCSYCHCLIEKSLKDGLKNKSCGCMKSKFTIKNKTKHGDGGTKKTKLYKVWRSMINRCEYKKNVDYDNYGGRGIRICKEWRNNYIVFKDWSLNNGYKEGLTIDRKDNDGNYEPSNCQWITFLENIRKRASNKINIEKARLIKKMYNNIRIDRTSISKICNISYNIVCDVINNKTWKEL